MNKNAILFGGTNFKLQFVKAFLLAKPISLQSEPLICQIILVKINNLNVGTGDLYSV